MLTSTSTSTRLNVRHENKQVLIDPVDLVTQEFLRNTSNINSELFLNEHLANKTNNTDKIELIQNLFSKIDWLQSLTGKDCLGAVEVDNISLFKGQLLSKLDMIDQKYVELNAYIFAKQSENTSDALSEQDKKTNQFFYASLVGYRQNKIVDFDNNSFIKKNDTVFDGNCGLNAVASATGRDYTADSRNQLIKVANAHDIFNSNKSENIKEIENIFSNFFHCKAYLNNRLSESIKSESNTEATKQSIQKKLGLLSNINSFDDLSDHEDLLLYLDFGFQHSTNYDKENAWLESDDIKALMLKEGYVCIHEGGAPYRTPEQNALAAHPLAQTVMRFKHLMTEQDAFIANNYNPFHYNSMANAKMGTHWVCVTPSH